MTDKKPDPFAPALDFWAKAASADTDELQKLLGPVLERRSPDSPPPPKHLLHALTDDESDRINKLLSSMKPEADAQLSKLARLLYGHQQ
jgi:hypothetical protein